MTTETALKIPEVNFSWRDTQRGDATREKTAQKLSISSSQCRFSYVMRRMSEEDATKAGKDDHGKFDDAFYDADVTAHNIHRSHQRET